MNKHTAGPWQLDDDGFIYGEGFIVSDPHSSPEIDIDEREANARLIAAAPEMLAALELVTAHDGKLTGGDWAQIQAAIAKATQS